MASKTSASMKTLDELLKAMLVFSRTVDQVLGTRAVQSASKTRLSSSKVQVLRLLGRRGPQTSTQTARFLGVSKPAVSQIIDAMVRAKQVTRQTGKTDRREVNLRITEKGRTLLNAVQQQQRHYVRAALRQANGASSKKWVEMMDVISNGLAQADQAYEEFCLQCGGHSDGTCVLKGGKSDCLFLKHEKLASLRGIVRPATFRLFLKHEKLAEQTTLARAGKSPTIKKTTKKARKTAKRKSRSR